MKSTSAAAQQELWLVQPKPWQPHKYQLQAVKWLVEHACAMLLLDPGLGKTSVTLAALRYLIDKKLIDKVLLVAPLRVCYSVWPAEREKWQDFNGLRVEILHGPDKDAALKRDADIYVINPEGLEWLFNVTKTRDGRGKIKVAVDQARVKQLGFDTLVIDELTMFKHVSSMRFKIMKQLINTFGRRWGLTGSPAANGLMDLFAQAYVIDGGHALGAFITHFRFMYFYQPEQYVYVPKHGAEQQIFERLKPLALRMSAEDHLDLPELVENDIMVDLPPKAYKIYKELENDLFVQLDKGVIAPANAGVASMKCRQVASGGVYLDRVPGTAASDRKSQHLHDAKTEALQELVEELQGQPLMVAYEFDIDLERLLEAFPKTPHVGGGVTPTRSKELEAQWNRGELPLLFVQPESIKHGLNLQERGYHVAFYTLTWNFETYDQTIRRVWRQGQKARRVFVHRFLARGTTDLIVRAALQRKDKGQQAFFLALRDAASARRN